MATLKIIFTLVVFGTLLLSHGLIRSDDCLRNGKANQIDCESKYFPVCGCNAITYQNACEAHNAGVLKFSQGSCK